MVAEGRQPRTAGEGTLFEEDGATSFQREKHFSDWMGFTPKFTPGDEE
jgi:hypothetical protein